MKLVNLTPHKINITGYGDIEPSGTIPRSHSYLSQVDSVEGIPIMLATQGDVSNMPPVKKGVLYVVSSYIRECLPERADLLSPSKLIRDQGGNIIGCGALQANNSYKK